MNDFNDKVNEKIKFFSKNGIISRSFGGLAIQFVYFK